MSNQTGVSSTLPLCPIKKLPVFQSIMTCRWKFTSFSSKSVGSFWQIAVRRRRDRPLRLMKQSTHPRLALKTCLHIFRVLATSFTFSLMMSPVTGMPFFSNTLQSNSRCLPLRGPVNFFQDCLQASIALLCFHHKRTLLSGTENSRAACLFPSFSARRITLRLHFCYVGEPVLLVHSVAVP